MKHRMIVLMVGCLLPLTAAAQFKSGAGQRPNVSESLVRTDAGGWLFGLFNPNNLSMRHSFSLSYSTFGGQGLSLGVYTNSLLYRLSAPLELQMDVSVVHSPYNTFGSALQGDLNGIYLTRAELNYRPTENFWLQLQFRQLPSMYWIADPYGSSRFFGGFHRQETGDQ